MGMNYHKAGLAGKEQVAETPAVTVYKFAGPYEVEMYQIVEKSGGGNVLIPAGQMWDIIETLLGNE